MTNSLKVILWGEEIGRLAWDERRRLAYFMYNPEWIKRGLNISPQRITFSELVIMAYFLFV